MTTKVSLGASKSLLVQFPFELRDVLVSDPDKAGCRRAVLQPGIPDRQEGGPDERLLLRHPGQADTDAGGFGRRGPECARRPHQALRSGSSVKSEMAGNAIVLTGLVRTPIDAARAGDLAFQFALANQKRDQLAVGCTQPTRAARRFRRNVKTRRRQGKSGRRPGQRKRVISSSTCSPSRARSR